MRFCKSWPHMHCAESPVLNFEYLWLSHSLWVGGWGQSIVSDSEYLWLCRLLSASLSLKMANSCFWLRYVYTNCLKQTNRARVQIGTNTRFWWIGPRTDRWTSSGRMSNIFPTGTLLNKRWNNFQHMPNRDITEQVQVESPTYAQQSYHNHFRMQIL